MEQINTTIKPSPASKSPPLSFKTRILIRLLSAATDFSRRRDGTVNRRIMSFLDPFTPPDPNPFRGVRTSDVTVDPTRDLWVRLFLPSTDQAAAAKEDGLLPVIVFFHGGGFAFLSPASRVYDIVCRRIARRLNAVVVSVNYRRSPEHKFPAPYLDGFDVLRFLDATPPPDLENVADLSCCFLMGDSAGGNIAHHVARRYASMQADEWARVRLSGSILVQPYFGGEERAESEVRLKDAPIVSIERTDWLWKAFLPEGADRDHEAANVFGPRDGGGEELGERFPATMVVVGGWDPLQDWQRRYAEKLKARGKEVRVVEYEDAVHAFYVFPEVKESGMLIDETKEFVQSHKRG